MAVYPAILLFSGVGAYSLKNNVFDVFMAIPFAILGYVFRKLVRGRAAGCSDWCWAS